LSQLARAYPRPEAERTKTIRKTRKQPIKAQPNTAKTNPKRKKTPFPTNYLIPPRAPDKVLEMKARLQNTTLDKPKTLTPASIKIFFRCPQMRDKPEKENKNEGTRTRGSNPGGRTTPLVAGIL